MALDYEAWLNQAQERLEQLYEQRAAIDEEIAALQRGIEGFSPLVQKYAPWRQEVVGITEAVMQVFKDNPNQMLTPRDVRHRLVNKGIKLEQQNPLATIHQTITRQVARGALKAYTVDGRTLYYYEQAGMPPQVTPETLKQFENNPLAGKSLAGAKKIMPPPGPLPSPKGKLRGPDDAKK